MELELNRSSRVKLNQKICNTISSIRGIKSEYTRKAQERLDSLTKPIGSLGRLEEIAAQYVAWHEEESPAVARKGVYVFAADHGITEEGVSLYPREVTTQMVYNFLAGGAAINVFSRQAQADVVVVDVGVDVDFGALPGLVDRKVRRGTRNFAREAAMSEEDVNAALVVGIDLACEAKRQGRSLIALGEMGIGNTSSATAIAAALIGLPVTKVTGRGTGLDEARCAMKARVIDQALRLHFGDFEKNIPDPVEILRRVGGLEIAAITGMVLGAVANRIAVVIDGFICTAGATVACAIAPDARSGIFAGHLSQEPGHRILLESMNLKPLLQLDMRLGEGTGAVVAFHLIESAVRIYNEMATFASAGVSETTVS
jgi:nicotinate-nucleotide--dimethylbenzimidazole phosphoribosyltransferase